MSKRSKVILWLAGTIILLVAAVAIVIPLVFNADVYKGQLIALVKKQTGRELSIQGEAQFTVFPWLGVKLNDLALSNAAGFGPTPFATIKSARLRAQLLPLLKKELRMDTVTLHGLTLNLSKNKTGAANWDDLRGKDNEKGDLPKLAAFAVGGLALDEATVTWNDQAGHTYTFNKVSLHSGALAPNTPFDLAVEFDLHSQQPDMVGHITMSGVGNADPANQRYQFNDALIKADLKGKALPGEALTAQVSTNISADLQRQTLTLAKLKASALGLNLSGTLQGSQLSAAPTFSGPLTLAEFNPRDVLKGFGITPPLSADPKTLSKAAASLQVEASARQINLNKISLRLDDSTATGNFTVANFSQPALRFNVALDQIDLDRYLPPKVEGQGKAATPATAAAAGAGLLPVETVRKLNLNGSLRIGKLKVANIRTANAVITLGAQNGLVKLHPLSANLYEGTYQGNMGFNAKGKVPQITLDESLKGVQAGPLLKDVFGKEKITGTATLSAKLRAQGNTSDALINSLSGQTAFAFANGAVKGVNIAQIVRDAQARLTGAAPAQGKEPNQTDFSELRGTGTISNGVLHNEDLQAKSPLLRVTGKGDAHLAAQTMDYLLNITLVNTITGQGGKELEQLRGLTIPLKVSGPFSNLSYRPDLNALLNERAKAEIEQKREELKQRLDEQLQDKLKGLFQ